MLTVLLTYSLNPHLTVAILCGLACSFSFLETQSTTEMIGTSFFTCVMALQLLYDNSYLQADSMFALWFFALFLIYKTRYITQLNQGLATLLCLRLREGPHNQYEAYGTLRECKTQFKF